MNRERYHAAFDGIQFREDFQEETVQKLLETAGQRQEKERSIMKAKHIKRTALIAAVLAVAVMATAAAVNLLHPARVADYMGNPALARAFESEDAIVLNESQPLGDYTITLMGVVSGDGLTGLYPEGEKDRSYFVAAVNRTDGAAIDPEDEGFQGLTVTPLIAGYQPWEVNIFTLGGGYQRTLDESMLTAYYIFDCASLEPFADHIVYLAAYEGMAPSSEKLQMDQDGSISFLDSYAGPHALFTLPLDSAKANPAAADAILDGIRNPAPDTQEEPPVDDENGEVKYIQIDPDGTARVVDGQQ